MDLCATKYVEPSGAYGLNDSNPCPSAAFGAGRQLGLVPLLDNASSSTRKALGALTEVRAPIVGTYGSS